MKIKLYRFVYPLVLILFNFNCYAQFGKSHVVAAVVDEAQDLQPADLDGDGDLDILIATADDNKIVWYENLGDGAFTAYKIISELSVSAWSVTASDIDDDGDLDVISASGGDGKIAWYENLGGGDFGFERIITMDAIGAPSVYSIDIDGDGRKDVLSTSIAENKVVWYRNLSGETFGPQIIISRDLLMPYAVFSIDINGNGFNDVLTASTVDDKISLFLNNGAGEFDSPILITDNAEGAKSIFAIDLDGDLDPDILSASRFDDKIAWYENLGEGDFGPQQILSLTSRDAAEVYSTDIDRDGDNDVLAVNSYYSYVELYENLGGGTFAEKRTIEHLGSGNSAVHAGDFDLDGEIDIVSAGNGLRRVQWFKNLGDLSFDEANVISIDNHFPLFGTSGDIDNDGDLDIITTSLSYGQIMIFENIGNSNFEREVILHHGGSEMVYSADLVDVDLDGDMDLITVEYSRARDDKLIWYENLGEGVFGEENIIVPDLNKGTSIVGRDLNGDGYPDIILSQESNSISWFSNERDGTFSSRIYIGSSRNPKCVFVDDIDNDGDNDVLVAAYDDNAIDFYENNGFGDFEDKQIISELAEGASWVDANDIDNDGDLDVLSASFIDNKIAWYENLGDGEWGEQIIISNEAIGARSVSSGDFDGDGDCDVVSATGTGNSIDWYENINGGFMSGRNISPRIIGARSVSTGDFDGDSDLDILTVGLTHQETTLFENKYQYSKRVSGKCFLDENGNGFKDSTELFMKFMDIQCLPTPDFLYTHTRGDYLADLDLERIENYEVMPELSALWTISSDSNSYHIRTDEFFESIDTLHFGFIPNLRVDSIITFLTADRPRCDTQINYWINVNNVGNTIPSGKIQLQLDDEITYLNADIEPDSIIDQTVYWHFDSLNYYDFTRINLQALLPGAELLGETLLSVLTVNIDSSEIMIFESRDTLRQDLVCAYDPNDKEVKPKGIDSLGYIKTDVSELDFTIRFQNTGTDTAFNVQIIDQLDPNLDWSTFTPLASSHEMTTTFIPSGEVVFKFENIFLPDSNVNEIGSHGFVRFRIDIKDDVPLGTSIFNRGDIYFDFNPAILTNTTVNTIIDCGHIFNSLIVPYRICQSDSIFAEAHIGGEHFDYTWSLLGDTIRNNKFNHRIDTNGVFNIHLAVSNPFCELDTTFTFDVLPNYFNILDIISICDGDSVLVLGDYEHSSGLYYDTLSTMYGCDTILIQELIVFDLPVIFIDDIDEEIVCLESGPVELSATPTDGVFSGAGMASNIFQPNEAGIGDHTIYYSLTDENGCSSKDSILISVVSCLGVSKLNHENFSIFPNPFSNYTTINFNEPLTENHTILIHDVLGKEVYRNENVTGTSLEIKKEQLGVGVYILSFYSAESLKLMSAKLVVE